MSILHAYHSKLPFRNIKGKPYITVSSRGISNGLSDTYNDGADFGPDTLLNATSPDQYGPPYTQTTGIQEAWNYAFATAKLSQEENEVAPGGVSNGYWMKPILLLDGAFIVNQKVFLSPTKKIVNPKMIGSGSMSTYVYWNFNDNCIEIDHTNPNIQASNIEIGYLQPEAGSNVGAGTAFFAANYVSGDPGYQRNVFQNYSLVFANTFNGNAMLSLTGFQNIMLYDAEAYSGGVYGILYAENSYNVKIFGSIITTGVPYLFYLNNIDSLTIYGSINAGNGGVLSNVKYVYIDKSSTYNSFMINGNVGYMHLSYVSNGFGNNYMLNTQSTSAVTINKLKIDYIHVFNNSGFTLLGSNLISINDISIGTLNVESGSTINLPTMSSASGTTAGTVNMRFTEYAQSHKKLIITFSGYENDTTTNQTISYPLPFSSYVVITGNNTGLTISASTSGITITSPNSTTTYSGIVIVEGY